MDDANLMKANNSKKEEEERTEGNLDCEEKMYPSLGE